MLCKFTFCIFVSLKKILGEIEAPHIIISNARNDLAKKSNWYDRVTLSQNTNLRVTSLQGTVRDPKTV